MMPVSQTNGGPGNQSVHDKCFQVVEFCAICLSQTWGGTCVTWLTFGVSPHFIFSHSERQRNHVTRSTCLNREDTSDLDLWLYGKGKWWFACYQHCEMMTAACAFTGVVSKIRDNLRLFQCSPFGLLRQMEQFCMVSVKKKAIPSFCSFIIRLVQLKVVKERSKKRV